MAYAEISVNEFPEFLRQHPHTVILDVRGQNEWEEGNIPGSILMPHWFVALKIHDVVPSYDTPIVAYCKSGGRSGLAAHTLDQLGYKQVYSLTGGYDAYVAKHV